MLRYVSVLNRYRGGIPLGFLIVKGAFESKGDPDAVASDGSVGLFQLWPHQVVNCGGYTTAQLKSPANNTKAFVCLLEGKTRDYIKTHPSYFPGGKDWNYWDVQFVGTQVGPGATRHLMNQVSPGGNTLSKIVAWIKAHPREMEASEHTKYWGSQSGKLVAFRVMMGKQFMDYARGIEKTGDIAPFAMGGAGVILLLGAATAGGVWWFRRRRQRRGISGLGAVGRRRGALGRGICRRETRGSCDLSSALAGMME